MCGFARVNSESTLLDRPLMGDQGGDLECMLVHAYYVCPFLHGPHALSPNVWYLVVLYVLTLFDQKNLTRECTATEYLAV